MRLTTILSFITIGIIFICSAAVGHAAAPGGYSNAKINTIYGSPDGALDAYQLLFTLHSGSGNDQGADVYLDGQSLSWPYDIRFTDGNDNLLSYWIESYDGASARVWVKMGPVPAAPGTTTVILYYGKAGDKGVSNGANTFMAFDDFSNNLIDTYWDEGYAYNGAWAWAPTHTIEHGGYHISVPVPRDGAGFLRLKSPLTAPSVSVVSLSYTNLMGRSPPWVYIGFDYGGPINHYSPYVMGYWGSTEGGLRPNAPMDMLQVKWSDGATTNNVKIYRDNSLITTQSADFGAARTPMFGLRTASMETIDAYFTYFYAYRYTANPPVQGAWSEKSSALDLSLIWPMAVGVVCCAALLLVVIVFVIGYIWGKRKKKIG